MQKSGNGRYDRYVAAIKPFVEKIFLKKYSDNGIMKIVRIVTVAVFLLSVLIWGAGELHAKKMDKIPPVIQSDSQEIHVSTSADEAELKKGLTATDNMDGDLTADIVVANISY